MVLSAGLIARHRVQIYVMDAVEDTLFNIRIVLL